MYSVEITIEKDRVTGETKVLSTNTLLPKNFAHQGVKVYEDDLKGDFNINYNKKKHFSDEWKNPKRTIYDLKDGIISYYVLHEFLLIGSIQIEF